MTTDKLPNGWTLVKFGDLVRNSNENSRDLEADGVGRVVGLDHLDPGSLRLVRWDELAELPDGTTFTRKFRPGQVLFGKRRAYQRKVAIPDFAGVCSGDILVFEPADDRMLADFLPYLVQSDGFFDHALGTSAGSLSPRTKWAELAKYEFALPPIDEQLKIVEVLTSVDAAIDAYVGVAELTESWICSYFREKVASSIRIRLGDVAEVDLGRQRAPKFDSGPNMLSYIRAANVKHGRLDLDDVLTMHFEAAEVERLKLRGGDVLITEGCGSLAEIGANAVWSEGLPGDVCFQNTVLRLRASGDLLEQGFLQLWADQAFVQGEFAEIATGTSIYHLGARRTAEMRMPLPPVEHQRQIVLTVRAARRTLSGAESSASDLRDFRSAFLNNALMERVPSVQ